MIVADGKQIAKGLLGNLKTQVKLLKQKPHLAVVLVGDDKPSQTYVRKKQEAAEEIGIRFSLHKYPHDIKESKLITEIKKIQQQKGLSGLIVQLPLPKGLDKKKVLNAIDPKFDVDYLTWESLGKLVIGENPNFPPTPGAILGILDYYKIKPHGKHVVLVGTGDLIGKPLANLLIQLPITLTVCNKETKDLAFYTKQADVLITGVGKYNLIRGNMVKKGVVVVDGGVAFYKGKMYGDINFDEVSKKASLVTPTPGGVGPITVAKLLENTVYNAKTLK